MVDGVVGWKMGPPSGKVFCTYNISTVYAHTHDGGANSSVTMTTNDIITAEKQKREITCNRDDKATPKVLFLATKKRTF